MRLWDRLLEAALPNWNVIREYAQEDGAEGAALRAQHADAIIIMGGEDVHPSLYGASQGYEAEGRHWYRADRGQIALVDYAVRTGTPFETLVDIEGKYTLKPEYQGIGAVIE